MHALLVWAEESPPHIGEDEDLLTSSEQATSEAEVITVTISCGWLQTFDM